MLLYALPMKKGRCWVLDLTGPPQAPAELTAPSVYALVVPTAPAAVYVGATKNLRARVRQHLTRSRSLLKGGRKDYHAPRSPAAAVLSRVIAGRAGLLVLRLEAVEPGNQALLRRLELAWLLVAAREELPVRRQRGPKLQWSGDPGELREAFRLARKRRWPELWVKALRPLCENHALPDERPTPGRRVPAAPAPQTKTAQKPRRGRPPKPRSARRGPAAKGESPHEGAGRARFFARERDCAPTGRCGRAGGAKPLLRRKIRAAAAAQDPQTGRSLGHGAETSQSRRAQSLRSRRLSLRRSATQ